jgi:hypothetical protein
MRPGKSARISLLPIPRLAIPIFGARVVKG